MASRNFEAATAIADYVAARQPAATTLLRAISLRSAAGASPLHALLGLGLNGLEQKEAAEGAVQDLQQACEQLRKLLGNRHVGRTLLEARDSAGQAALSAFVAFHGDPAGAARRAKAAAGSGALAGDAAGGGAARQAVWLEALASSPTAALGCLEACLGHESETDLFVYRLMHCAQTCPAAARHRHHSLPPGPSRRPSAPALAWHGPRVFAESCLWMSTALLPARRARHAS